MVSFRVFLLCPWAGLHLRQGAPGGRGEGWGGVALFAGLGPLGSPTSPQAAVTAAGLTSTSLGGGPSSPVRGDRVQRVGPTCLEGRGRARTFLSQDAGSVWGSVQEGEVSKAPDFCQRTGKRSPRQPESDRDKPEKGLQSATMRWFMTSGLSPKLCVSHQVPEPSRRTQRCPGPAPVT